MLDIEEIDLAKSIPYILVNAMRNREVNIVRGLLALSGAIMWHFTHASIHLVELIAKSRRQNEAIYSGELATAMYSSREREIVTDFVDWGLLEYQIYDETDERWVIPDIWDVYLGTLDELRPNMGLESMGKLLGICSLAKHADRRRHIGKSYYMSVKAVAVRARNLQQDGAIGQDEAEQAFCLSCSDSERKWGHLVYGDKQKVASLRFFSDMTGDLWVVNRDVIVAIERVIGRSNELVREMGI